MHTETLKKANNGDQHSVDSVCEYSLSFLNKYVRCFISSRADADDLIQEILIVVQKALKVGRIERIDGFLAKTAQKFITRYRNGEYSAGKRRQLSSKPYKFTEIPMTSVFGETAIDELENFIDVRQFIR